MTGNTSINLLEDIKLTHKGITVAADAIFTAHKQFVEQHNNYLALYEQRLKELEAREAAIGKQEQDVKVANEGVVNREKKCLEREQQLEQREKQVQAKEKTWIETEKRMAQNADKIPSLVHLNIGGPRFSFTKDVLMGLKGSLFEEMLVSNHSQQLPATGELYIDRDPKYFHYISSFIRTGVFALPKDSDEQNNMRQEFVFYKIYNQFQGTGSVTKQPNIYFDACDSDLPGLSSYITQCFPNATSYQHSNLQSPCVILTFIVVNDRIDINRWKTVCSGRTDKTENHFVILACNKLGGATGADGLDRLTCKALYKTEFSLELDKTGMKKSAKFVLDKSSFDVAFATIKSQI